MINESKFNMWRAMIGIFYADGMLDSEERSFFNERLKVVKFSEEQKSILLDNLQSGVKFEEAISKVTDKKDRAFILHQIRVISNIDNDFEPEEHDLLLKYEELLSSEIDIKDEIMHKLSEIKVEADNIDKKASKRWGIFSFIIDRFDG